MNAVLLATMLICLTVVSGVIAFSVTRRDRLRSFYFTILCASVGMYLLGYILELLSPGKDAIIIALKVKNFGLPLVGPFFLLFILNICQYQIIRRWMMYGVYAYGVLMAYVILLNESHYLYYTSFTYVPVADMHYTVLGYGPLYYFQEFITITCVMLCYLAILYRMRTWPQRKRTQMSFYIAASVLPILISIICYLGIIPYVIDPEMIIMMFSVLLSAVAAIRYNLFDTNDIASETAFESMDDAMIVVDGDWHYRFSNKAAKHLFPYLNKLVGSEDITKVQGWPAEINVNTTAGRVNFEINRNGQRSYYRAQIGSIKKENTLIGWTIVISDVTEMSELLEKLNMLAITDGLTGLYNRRYFLEAVQREMEIAKRQKIVSAMAIFDLDHFKLVNDTYGHKVGDIVLKMVAETIKKELRPYDIFARYGGEEFAIYIINISVENAEKFANRLCMAIKKTSIMHQGIEIKITASFGIVPVHWYDSVEEAISFADASMYHAKQGGRNRVEMGFIQRKDHEIAEQIRAFKSKRGG